MKRRRAALSRRLPSASATNGAVAPALDESMAQLRDRGAGITLALHVPATWPAPGVAITVGRLAQLLGEGGSMTDQIDGLIQELEEKRTELVRSIRAQSSHLSVCESEHELTDRMQGMCRRDEAAMLLEGLTCTLAGVDAALAAAKEGSYGICVECGQPIASRRLRTIPWASRCVRCQELVEQRNLGRGAPRWEQAA
jgi:DnaK suppressor protein